MSFKKPVIKVKIVHRSGDGSRFPWVNQCPEEKPIWGQCEFISLPSQRDYDWYVAVDDIPRIQPGKKEVLACSADNTILITTEPSSVTRYGKHFASQFKYVLTNQEESALAHSNAIRSQTGNVWFYEKTFSELEETPPIKKTKTISTVCSSKQQAHTMHARRYTFTQKLKKELPELEIFGHGVRFVEKKSEALDPYKFHLVVENHIAQHVWTEKLADAFLAYTVPIYCGCPNVLDYFPADSIIPININDFEGSLKVVKEIFHKEGEYERRLEAVKEARRLVMYEYNLPAMIDRIISGAPSPVHAPGGVIYGRQIMRLRQPMDFVRFATWRTMNFCKKLSSYFRS